MISDFGSSVIALIRFVRIFEIPKQSLLAPGTFKAAGQAYLFFMYEPENSDHKFGN